MNFYNPQMPPQSQPSHMYGIVQQQQQHFRDPNMLNQQANQMNPYVVAGQNSGTPPQQQPAGQQIGTQQYNMIQPNPSQPVV